MTGVKQDSNKQWKVWGPTRQHGFHSKPPKNKTHRSKRNKEYRTRKFHTSARLAIGEDSREILHLEQVNPRLLQFRLNLSFDAI